MSDKPNQMYKKSDTQKGPQAQCFESADENQRIFFVAKQYLYENQPIYSYESHKTIHHFLDNYAGVAQEKRTYFELIRESRPCLEYYDIEWTLSDTAPEQQEEAIFNKLVELRNLFAPECPVETNQCRVTSSSFIPKSKGSMHVVVFSNYAFHNNHIDQDAFMKAFKKYCESPEIVCQETNTESDFNEAATVVKESVDWRVYTRNRTMRCLDSTKCKAPERPFVKATWHEPSMGSPANEFYITNVMPHVNLIDLDSIARVPKDRQYGRPLGRKYTALSKSHLSASVDLFNKSPLLKTVEAAMGIFQTSKKCRIKQAKNKNIDGNDDNTMLGHWTTKCSSMAEQFDAISTSQNAETGGIIVNLRRIQPDTLSLEVGNLPYSGRIQLRDTLVTKQEIDFDSHEEYSEKYLRYCRVNSSLIIRSPTGSGGKLIQKNRVVVQAESMWRLDQDYYKDRRDKVVFIMDEFCSLIEQFTSSKTMGNHHQACVAKFGLFQSLAHKVIALDADFTNSDVELLKERRDDFYIIHNKYSVHSGDTVIFHETETMLQDEMLKVLEKGNVKMWILSTHSAEHTEAIHTYLEGKGYHGKCMTANTLDSDKRLIIRDIKTILDDNDYFISTPVVSVGVDYNIPDTVDYVVGFFNTQSGVTVETCRQMLRRPRHVKTHNYLIHMGDKFNDLPTTTSDVTEWLCSNDCMIRQGPSAPENVPYDDGADLKLKLQDIYYNRRGTTNALPDDEYTIRKFYLALVYNLGYNYDMTAEWVSSYNSEKEISIYKNLCQLRNGVKTGLSERQSMERSALDYFDQNEDQITNSIHRRAESRVKI
ncbi:hypothetical protein BGX27_000193 [Mortierella sp. AM989]|nr:hypothetical protein BGX27_000193 [Mortierella sp. AM989]